MKFPFFPHSTAAPPIPRLAPRTGIGLLVATVLILAARPACSAPRADVTIPLSRTPNGQILLPVSVNGRPPVPFVLATGSDRCVLDPSFAASLGLAPRNAASGHPAAPGELPEVKLGSVQISGDGRAWHDLKADLSAVPLSAIVGQPVSGFLGMNVLKHYAMLLDFAGGHISLFAGGVSDADAVSLGFTRDHLGGARRKEKKLRPSERSVSGIHIATETRYGRFPAAVAADADSKFAARIATVHGTVPVVRIVVSDVKIAGWALDGAVLWDVPTGDHAPNQDLQPAIGMEFLRRFSRVLLDNALNRVWFGAPLDGTDDAGSSAAKGPPQPAVSLPLQRTAYGQVLIPVRVDGRPPVLLMLDTGSDSVALDPSSVNSSSILGVVQSGGKDRNWGLTILNSLQIPGDTHVWHRELALYPTTALPIGPPMAGILGMNVLEHYTVLLDFAGSRVTLYRGGVSDAGAASLGFSKAHVSPIQSTPHTSRTSHSAAVDMPFDTGRDTTTIPTSIADLLSPRDGGETFTLYGTAPVRFVDLPWIKIAGWKLQGPLTLNAPYSDSPANPAMQPALGMDILSRFSRVLLDLPNNRAWFGPPLPDAAQKAVAAADSNGTAAPSSAGASGPGGKSDK